MKIWILFFLSIFSPFSFSEEFYKKVFPQFERKVKHKIEDSVSAEKNNIVIYSIYSKNKLLGFARDINTTTGCNSACLPVVYTGFYNQDGTLLKIMSKVGLTKIGHAPFTEEDYLKLDFILSLAPKEFQHVSHPTDLTDAITGATKKEYQEIVVPGAAYSTLRIHLYNQETLKFLKALRKKLILSSD